MRLKYDPEANAAYLYVSLPQWHGVHDGLLTYGRK